jgi:hypothetical protein
VLILHKHMHASRIVLAGALLGLAGCGSGSQVMNSGNFSGTVATQSDRATGTLTSRTGVASVRLSPAHLIGGASTEITVILTQPAPGDGIAVQLRSSDASVVATPATVRIPSGQTSATVAASTSPVSAATAVAISALYGDTVAGTSLNIAPATTSPFTVAIKPSTVTIATGHSGSTKVTTKVTSGFDETLHLTVSKVPAGVSVTLTPSVIPAPGAGTSNAHIAVSESAAPGTYSLRVKASDGTTSQSATLTLDVASSGPGATFQGCWYQQDGNRYQGVTISVANPGTYPFNAVLYYGATCDPNNWADEFGFGTPLSFGGFDWIFWFTDFANQSDMSAFWYVGNDKSKCVSYAVAPDC